MEAFGGGEERQSGSGDGVGGGGESESESGGGEIQAGEEALRKRNGAAGCVLDGKEEPGEACGVHERACRARDAAIVPLALRDLAHLLHVRLEVNLRIGHSRHY